MRYRITDNRIGAPALLETDSGSEAMAFCVTLPHFRVYRDGTNVALGFMENNAMHVRSPFPSISAIFED